MMARARTVLLGAAAALPMLAPTAGETQSRLTVAMTAGDLPVVTGSADQGFEVFRFVAFNLYDALVGWDLSRFDNPRALSPKVRGFVQAQSWFQDLTPITIVP